MLRYQDDNLRIIIIVFFLFFVSFAIKQKDFYGFLLFWLNETSRICFRWAFQVSTKCLTRSRKSLRGKKKTLKEPRNIRNP